MKITEITHPKGQYSPNYTLEQFVAQEIADNSDDYDGNEKQRIAAYINDLMKGGCASGFVSCLIYHSDTRAFYDRFYNEIEDLRRTYEWEIGEPIRIPEDTDLKNFMAWFAFEETARAIANKLELDV